MVVRPWDLVSALSVFLFCFYEAGVDGRPITKLNYKPVCFVANAIQAIKRKQAKFQLDITKSNAAKVARPSKNLGY
jgi:hypothetical protein